MSPKQIRALALLLIPSFCITVGAVLLREGIGQTPQSMQDSAGRRMGFNDPLSFEHYKIILKNVSWSSLCNPGHAYDWLLLGMQIAGAAILISRTPLARRLEFWFFISQPVFFPFAVFGIPMLPLLTRRLLVGRLDREDIIDIPFVWCTAHAVWVLTSVAVALFLRAGVLRREWISSRGQSSTAVEVQA